MRPLDYTIFRNNLKKARSLMNLTGKDLSIEAGLKQMKRISDIEEGRGKPSLEEVYSICSVLNQPIDKMMNCEAKIVMQYE